MSFTSFFRGNLVKVLEGKLYIQYIIVNVMPVLVVDPMFI